MNNIDKLDGTETEEEMDDKYFAQYKRLRGKASREKFVSMLPKFFEIILDPYVYGEGEVSRDEAWTEWVKVIGNEPEAGRYFKAIDSVTALT